MSRLELILDLDYDKLFFDSEKNKYYVYSVITHIGWYDIVLELDDSDTGVFISGGQIDREKFRKFASEVAASRPGLTYRENSFDSKILERTDGTVLKIEEIINRTDGQK